MLVIDKAPEDGATRLDWMLKSVSMRAACFCLVAYTLGALILAPTAYAAFIEHYMKAIAFFLPKLILPIMTLGLVVWLGGTPRPEVAAHLVGRLPLLAILAVALLAAFTGYTTFKFKIPDIVPFYADHWAAGVDAWLHRGDPWVFAHTIWPEAWAGSFLYFYNYIWFLYWFGTPIFVLLWQPHAMIKRYLWSILLTFMVCGTILATSLSSVGPIFYSDFFNDGRFDALNSSLAGLEMSFVLNYADYLLSSYRQQDAVFGTGISAIPSMHVAVVTLNAWLFTSLNRWAGALAWIYAAIIFFGSIYTGWHYAVDGYISMLTVSVVWFAVRRAHRRNVVSSLDPDLSTPQRAGCVPGLAAALDR